MKRERGFTLIELAIVLVIIGIIIGMVLKGQDLIQNARMKKFINKVRHWETYTWIYFDRKGRFPGDSDKDGKIGDGDVCFDIVNAKFANPPYEGTPSCVSPGGNTITLGSNTFYVFFGNDGGTPTPKTPEKNVMIICVSVDCDTTFTDEQIAFAESLDTSLDGTADGTSGQVICTSSAPDTITAENWKAVYSAAPTAEPCTAGTTRAVVYYFDAKRLKLD